MTIALKNIPKGNELSANDVTPVVANVKYAQRAQADIAPVVANVKYAQRAQADIAPVVANVKYAQRAQADIAPASETGFRFKRVA